MQEQNTAVGMKGKSTINKSTCARKTQLSIQAGVELFLQTTEKCYMCSDKMSDNTFPYTHT